MLRAFIIILLVSTLAACGWGSTAPAESTASQAPEPEPPDQAVAEDTAIQHQSDDGSSLADQAAAAEKLQVREQPETRPAPPPRQATKTVSRKSEAGTVSEVPPKPRSTEPVAAVQAATPARPIPASPSESPEPTSSPQFPPEGRTSAEVLAPEPPESPRAPTTVVPPSAPRPGSSGSAEPSYTLAPRVSPDAPLRPAPVAAPGAPVVIPEGTVLEVRTTEFFSSENSRSGDHFTVVLDRDVTINDQVVLAKGTHLEGRLIEVIDAGKVKGRASMTFRLEEIDFGDEPIRVETNSITLEAEASKGDDLKKVGVAAAVGTTLGAIFGGKKGAAIGGAAGAGAGTAGVLVTKGEPVEVAKERLFSFRVERDVTLNP